MYSQALHLALPASRLTERAGLQDPARGRPDASYAVRRKAS